MRCQLSWITYHLYIFIFYFNTYTYLMKFIFNLSHQAIIYYYFFLWPLQLTISVFAAITSRHIFLSQTTFLSFLLPDSLDPHRDCQPTFSFYRHTSIPDASCILVLLKPCHDATIYCIFFANYLFVNSS